MHAVILLAVSRFWAKVHQNMTLRNVGPFTVEKTFLVCPFLSEDIRAEVAMSL